MKSIILSLLFLSIVMASAEAQTYSCKVFDQDFKSLVTLAKDVSGRMTLTMDQKAFPVLRFAELKLTSAQVDKCPIIEPDFDKCIRSVFGKISVYQAELPSHLAYLRYKATAGELQLHFDTNKIVRGEAYVITDLNPASGWAGFIRFYDKFNTPVGQIMEMGLGQLAECTEVSLK